MQRRLMAAVLGSCALSCDPSPTISNPDCVEPTVIEAGWFWSGCEPGDYSECVGAEPLHPQWLESFEIDTCEATVADYRSCIEAGAGPEFPAGDCFDCNIHDGGREDHPMNCGGWMRAEAYCAWAGGRLPTALEFEKASRGTDGRRFPWGNEPPTCDRLNYDQCEYRFGPDTDPVGTLPDGASPYGVLDLAGNVRELVFLPPHPDGPTRMHPHDWRREDYAQVGGAYNSPIDHVTPWAASFQGGGYVDNRVGFRCAYDLARPVDEPDPQPDPSLPPQHP